MTPTTNFIGQRVTINCGLYAGLAGTIVKYLPAGHQHGWRPMLTVKLDRAIALMFFENELETIADPE